jgi:hypothetical protein
VVVLRNVVLQDYHYSPFRKIFQSKNAHSQVPFPFCILLCFCNGVDKWEWNFGMDEIVLQKNYLPIRIFSHEQHKPKKGTVFIFVSLAPPLSRKLKIEVYTKSKTSKTMNLPKILRFRKK